MGYWRRASLTSLPSWGLTAPRRIHLQMMLSISSRRKSGAWSWLFLSKTERAASLCSSSTNHFAATLASMMNRLNACGPRG